MSFNSTENWMCDVCLQEVTLVRGSSHRSGDSPDGWKIGKLEFDHTQNDGQRWKTVNKLVMCDECFISFNRVAYADSKSKAEYSKPFWRKFFGKETK